MKAGFIGIGILLTAGAIFYYMKGDVSMKEPQIIPRDHLFSNADHLNVRISPDGTHLAYLAPYEGVMNVWVKGLEKESEPKALTQYTDRNIQSLSWSFDNKHILYEKDTAGDENWKIYKLDIGSGKSTLLTPEKGVMARLVGQSYLKPTKIIISQNDRNPQFHDVYEYDIETNKKQLVYENNKFVGFLVDDTLDLQMALEIAPGQLLNVYKYEKGEWIPHKKLENKEDTYFTSPVFFSKEGEKAYWINSVGREYAALTVSDIKTKEENVLFEPEKGNIGGITVHPTENTPIALDVNYEKEKNIVLDDRYQKDFDYLDSLGLGAPQIISQTLDFGTWIIAFDNGAKPPVYYLYDRDKGEATYLFHMFESLKNYDFAKTYSRTFKAQDGMELVSYLTLPKEIDKGGKAKKPVPMILFVHGGPKARDTFEYSRSWHYRQWMANRGYAVLQVNYRGSYGLGKTYMNAGNGQYAEKMHDDLIDGVKWAVSQGVTTPDKVCIFGGSYGGYATLVGLTMTPHIFACGISIVGISNLQTLYESYPEYWKPMIDQFVVETGGDPRTVEGKEILRKKSPLTYVDQIQRPLLIVHGKNDPRVKQAESDQIVKAMQERDIPVTYLLYPDEGHGLSSPKNKASFFAASEKFLADILGGRFEPIKDELEKSSVQVVAGQV